MDWLKKKKRLVRDRERGARLLEDLIECCDGKSNPIKFFSADEIIKATSNFSESNRAPGLYYHCYSGKIDNHGMVFFMNTDYGYCRDIVISSMASGHKKLS